MATTTANYGWGNPASGDGQAASELLISATIDAIDADLAGVQAASALAGYYAPVTDGDPGSPALLFDAAGDVIVAWHTL